MAKLAGWCVVIWCATLSVRAEGEQADRVDFPRDVRPLLSSMCFHCHGPDESHREADLRLDTRDALESGVVIAGDPDASELIARVLSDDPELRMPPPDSGLELTPAQIDLLVAWVRQGANWTDHWAFTPPRQPPVPDPVAHRSWIRNPIDAFVAASWDAAKLDPAPPAPPELLLRRIYLDLVGLPPMGDVARELAELDDDGAYERLVEQLLASPHHGEKWGRHWLDAARYADSDGFEKDKPRRTWMYRDWVVQALNEDLPYDQFVVEQVAGDLLPSPTQDQLVATGFLRQSMLNEEGGIDPEQFRMEAMFDRMDAIGKAVLGLTVQCAQCHSHKYDPLTHAEYFQMFAFLNNSDEGSRPVYPGREQEDRARVLAEVRQIENELRDATPDWPVRIAQWMDAVRGDQPNWNVLELHNANDNAQRYHRRDDGALLAQGYAPTRFDAFFTAVTDQPVIRAFRLELLTDPNLPAHGPGRSLDGLCALTEWGVEVHAVGDPAEKRAVEFIQASADFANEHQVLGTENADQSGTAGSTGPIQYAIDGQDATAWGIDAGPGRRNATRTAVFVAKENIARPEGSALRFRLSQKHGGWNSDDNQTMNLGCFRISITDQADAMADPLPPSVRAVVESGAAFADLPQHEQEALFAHWRTTVPEWSDANARIDAWWREHPEGTTQLVLHERPQRRPTFRLNRGDFLDPREEVAPGTPAFMHAPRWSGEPTRLDFARWLVDRQSPTTARAIVNRVWQAYFGAGLVETSEDFGSQATAPSHPDLLDWLAVEFMEQGWSLKWLHRLIVTSATYRQSSRTTPEKWERDPANRWLARGPRFRLDAELVRDGALASSGLLHLDIGGPAVFPPAPSFLFQPPASYGPKSWPYDEGPAKYRRGLYTFRFRSVPYPVFTVFDGPEGTSSCTRRSRSNTPLQALTTLNEPLFVECAQALARETLAQTQLDDNGKLAFAFRRCAVRVPDEGERGVLSDFLKQCRGRFHSPDSAGDALLLAGLEGSALANCPSDVAVAELAAWTAVCRVILNLDESITKE